MNNSFDELPTNDKTELGTAHYNAGNIEEGIRLWQLGAGEDDLRALYNLGVVEREAGNFESAIMLWLKPGAAGNVDAQFNLGLAYSRQGNREQAEEWFVKAEEAGDSQATIMLAIMRGEDTSGPEFNAFRESDEVASEETEQTEDLETLLEKANRGDVEAANEIGTHYGRLGDFEEAIRYHLIAAEAGGIEAQGNVGVDYYRQGKTEEAIQWYQKAARAGSSLAQNNLGTLYLSQGKPELAEPWLKMGIESGNINSIMNLAQIRANEGNLKAVIELLEPLADDGIADARNDLALAYVRTGHHAKAKANWTAAAQQGHTFAMVNLGIFFSQQGNKELALQWLNLADSLGQPAAKHALASISE
ncbi:MAG: hypothetical protein RLZZ340_447 [Actinomycetota bacterium]